MSSSDQELIRNCSKIIFFKWFSEMKVGLGPRWLIILTNWKIGGSISGSSSHMSKCSWAIY